MSGNIERTATHTDFLERHLDSETADDLASAHGATSQTGADPRAERLRTLRERYLSGPALAPPHVTVASSRQSVASPHKNKPASALASPARLLPQRVKGASLSCDPRDRTLSMRADGLKVAFELLKLEPLKSMAAASTPFRARMSRLQAEGWTVRLSAQPGRGSFTDHKAKLIVVDRRYVLDAAAMPVETFAMLSHEFGHAEFPPIEIDPEGMMSDPPLAEQTYIALSTESALDEEGEAVLAELTDLWAAFKSGVWPQVLRDQLARHRVGCQQIFMQYVKPGEHQGDREWARRALAQYIGDNDRPCTQKGSGPSLTYRQYYERMYAIHWKTIQKKRQSEV